MLLVALMGLLGFGLTNLTRNTGAALGVGFVYFSVVQIAVAILRPAWQPWLVQSNISGLLLPGGTKIYLPESSAEAALGDAGPAPYVLGNLQAGVFLCLVTAAVVGAGVALFARRDVH